MASSSGDFGSTNAPHQCTATSKRSGKRCKGPSVLGSDKCRMHGGKTGEVGTRSPTFKHGRYSRYLPTNIDQLFQDSVTNPELLELSDHVALLEARVMEILQILASGEPFPRWSIVAATFGTFETALLSGKMDEVVPALEKWHAMMDNGAKWDRSWDEIQVTLEQLRKLVDTEVKRKKELGQMVPIERVMILMAAVADAVKRNVKDPEAIQAVYHEIRLLHGTNGTPAEGRMRVPETVSLISSESKGVGGGRSREALRRRKILEGGSEGVSDTIDVVPEGV